MPAIMRQALGVLILVLLQGRAAAESCANPANGGCQNGSECRLNAQQFIWCANCPQGYSGYRCEIAPAGAGVTGAGGAVPDNTFPQKCGPPATGGNCQNGSICRVSAEGWVWCEGCPQGYSGNRCEMTPAGTVTTTAPVAPVAPPAATTTTTTAAAATTFTAAQQAAADKAFPQQCGPPASGGPCQNGSTCKVSAGGWIYCEGCPAGITGYRCEVLPAGYVAPATAAVTAPAPAAVAPVAPAATTTTTATATTFTAAQQAAADKAFPQQCGPPASGGPCQNGSTCKVSAGGWIYCEGCPAGITGYRCEVLPAGYVAPATVTAAVTAPAPVPAVVTPVVVAAVDTAPDNTFPQVCGPPATGGNCQNGSTCKVSAEGWVYCEGCPFGYTGYRCQNPPGAVGAVGAAPAAPDAPVSNLPQTVVDGQFEAGNANTAWQQNCAMYSEKVTVGGQDGPTKARNGANMLKFRAQDWCTGEISQRLQGVQQGVTYHIQAWIWLPWGSPCTTDKGSDRCPYIGFNADGRNDGSGTLLTANGGAWNAISGSFKDNSGQGVTLRIQNIQAGNDIYIDDISAMRCSVEDFRAYAQPKIEQLRQRNVRLVMPARNGEAVATVTQTRHLYPFGAAVTSEDLNISPAFKAFFQKHFNTVTDEVYQKWDAQEPNEGQQDWGKGDALYNFAKDNGMYHRAHVILQESGIPQWLSWLPRDGGYRSVQSALWKRLNDYINRYDQFTLNYDVINEINHYGATTNLLPCNPWDPNSPCICWSNTACPPDMGLARDTSVAKWAFVATKYLLNKKGSGGKSLLQNDFCFDTFCGPANSISTMVKSTKATGSTGYGLQAHVGSGGAVCGFDLMMRATEVTAATPGSTVWFTELDVEDGYMETRGQGYEHFFLAAYAHAQVGGLVLWGWAKETIAPGQAGRGNTRLVNNVWDMSLNDAGQRIFGANGLLSSKWRSNVQRTVPAGGASFDLRLYKGSYTVEIGGCRAYFTVNDGGDTQVIAPTVFQCGAATARGLRGSDSINGSDSAAAPDAITEVAIGADGEEQLL